MEVWEGKEVSAAGLGGLIFGSQGRPRRGSSQASSLVGLFCFSLSARYTDDKIREEVGPAGARKECQSVWGEGAYENGFWGELVNLSLVTSKERIFSCFGNAETQDGGVVESCVAAGPRIESLRQGFEGWVVLHKSGSEKEDDCGAGEGRRHHSLRRISGNT